ncbi:PQQ-binding-like beta-propeller repeat protein [Dyella halodurans]|uniref:PQQ-binding-like beta-propeller repeat protein n=1 Tax=Dyella halodurans TaxID=1920171 RepID=A0ABV9C6F4_9GAMM|nr:PQQ-binding-like beta-propeller repeat protein [Dyella halodurans]
MKKLLLCLLLGSAVAQPAIAASSADMPYAVTGRYALGGDGGWDYLTLDSSTGRLYIARDNRIMVVDAATGKLLGEVAGMQHAHGVALLPAEHRAYVSNGHGDNVSVVDTRTLKIAGQIALSGKDPDAIVFDEASGHLLTMNGHSNNVSVIDAKAGKELGTIAVPGRPEFAVADGKGQLFLNLEDKNALAHVDLATGKVVKVSPLAPCDGPTGLAFDAANRRLFSVCANGWMIVTDADSGHLVAKLPIGKDPDAVVFDAQRKLVLGSSGEGSLSVVAQDGADHYHVVGNLPTKPSARTLALDSQSHTVYLAAADAAAKGKPVQGFGVLVVTPVAGH